MAYPVQAPAVSHSGSYTPVIYSGKLLDKFYKATVFGAIANTDYEGEIKDKGDTVRIRTVPDISIRDYEIGMNLQYDDMTPGYVDLLIDRGKYFGLSIRDVQRLQADIAYMDKWAEDGSEQLKISVDSTILAGMIGQAHAKNKGATAGKISEAVNLGTTGAPLALDKANIVDTLVMAGQCLDEQNVPENGRYVVLPAWAASRIKLSDLKDASLSGDGTSMLRNGRLGRIDRFELYSSNNLPVVTDGSDKCTTLFCGHKSALTFASQIVKTEGIPNPNDFGEIMRGLQVFGFKVIKPESLVEVYAKAA